MTNEDIGTALTKARTARGLSLYDVERDTRINRKYLQALEEGHLDAMPAPVYARAFMRTYAQYLGLNAGSLVQQLPGAKPEQELPPLPHAASEARPPLVSAGWIASGAVVILLLGVGLLLFWNRGGGDDAMTSVPPPAELGLGAEQSNPPVDEPLPPPVVVPGEAPDLEGQPYLVALATLLEADILYVIIEAPAEDVPEGAVFEQTPRAGARLSEGDVITLLVAALPPP
jgi:transcriptional regulator with XRE-family HTH domain